MLALSKIVGNGADDAKKIVQTMLQGFGVTLEDDESDDEDLTPDHLTLADPEEPEPQAAAAAAAVPGAGWVVSPPVPGDAATVAAICGNVPASVRQKCLFDVDSFIARVVELLRQPDGTAMPELLAGDESRALTWHGVTDGAGLLVDEIDAEAERRKRVREEREGMLLQAEREAAQLMQGDQLQQAGRATLGI